jgi:PAS domain S-box-containing protein
MSALPEIRILLVEDSPSDARLLQLGLKEVKDVLFAVTWVDRLAEAVAILGEQTFDVGLLDLTLPDSAGSATYQKIQNAAPGLALVVLTGAADETAGTDAIRRGVQDYLVKGVAGGTTVARVIRYAIERKQANARLYQLNAELERRVNEIQVANNALQESRTAALNLMEDAVEARKLAERTSLELTRVAEERGKALESLRTLNRALKALSASSKALTQTTEEDDFLREVCRIVQEDCGHAMVWIGFANENDEEAIRPVAYAGFEEGYLETLKLTWSDSERGRGPTGTAIRTGLPSECRNMLTDPTFTPWREDALKRGYASSVALPLFTMARDRAFGAITIYDRKPEAFSADEVVLLSELASDLALGIQTIRLRTAHARAEDAVRESEARFRSLFNGMTEGFALHEILCDEEGNPADYRFLDVNPAFEKLTGLSRQDIIGKTRSAIPLLLDDDSKLTSMYGRVAISGEPVHFESYSTALKAHFNIFSYQPAPMQFAVIVMNITEQMENRKKIDELNMFLKRRAAELSSSYNELQSLTRLLSHDLRVPLRVVSGYSHLLLKEYSEKIDASGNKYIRFLDSGVQQVNQLLDKMLLLSGISQKQMWLQRVNLSEAAKEIAEDLKRSQPERKVDFVIRENVQEVADQGFMKQVLQNLFENAWKFTASRERSRIEFGVVDRQEPQVCFVRDNGVGFDPQDATTLFAPFHRFTAGNESSTAGVGLAVVERIIQRHGGKVWAEGEKDKGAVFYFKLG